MTIYDMWAKVKDALAQDALAQEGTPCGCHLCEGFSKAINTIDDYVDWLFPRQGSAKDNNVSTNQPDPITGLVPCGCKGKPEYHSSKYGYVASVKMHAECSECHAKTDEYYAFLYSDDAREYLQRKVMDAWNTMRGYKEVPE